MRNGLVIDPNGTGKVLRPCLRRYVELFCAAGVLQSDRMRWRYPPPIGQARGKRGVAGFRFLGILFLGSGSFVKLYMSTT